MELLPKRIVAISLFDHYFTGRSMLRENRPAETRLTRVSQGTGYEDLKR